MAVSAKVGTFLIASTDTVGATQEITVGFEPKVIFFWLTGQDSATDAVSSQTAKVSFGVASSTTSRRSVGSLSTDNSGTISEARIWRNDAVICSINALGTSSNLLLDVSATSSTSFTVIVDDQSSDNHRISYMAIGGSDITNIDIGDYAAPTSTGNSDVTSLSFQPDFLLLFGNSATSAPNNNSGSDGAINIGAATSSTKRGVIAFGNGPESNADSQSRSYLYTGEVWACMPSTPTTLTSRADFVSFLSNGFRLNWLEAATAFRVFYVAIKGGSWTVGDLLTQTDTSTAITESGFGFQPAGTMLFSHNMAESAQDTVDNDGRLSIGAFTSTSERVAHAYLNETGLTVTDVNSAIEYDAVYANISTSAAIQGLADVQSIDSDGFTLIMDDADPSQAKAWYFSVGSTPTSWTLSIDDSKIKTTIESPTLTYTPPHYTLSIADSKIKATIEEPTLTYTAPANNKRRKRLFWAALNRRRRK